MFALPTLPKILLILFVIAVVWWFFRRGQARGRADDASASMKRTAGKGDARRIEDMVKCAKCGAYVPAGAASCASEGCPVRA